jgi:hypothetical protein
MLPVRLRQLMLLWAMRSVLHQRNLENLKHDPTYLKRRFKLIQKYVQKIKKNIFRLKKPLPWVLAGRLVLAAMNDRQFERLCGRMGLNELASDPKYATNPARVAQRVELLQILQKRLAEDTTDTWLTILDGSGLACAILLMRATTLQHALFLVKISLAHARACTIHTHIHTLTRALNHAHARALNHAHARARAHGQAGTVRSMTWSTCSPISKSFIDRW